MLTQSIFAMAEVLLNDWDSPMSFLGTIEKLVPVYCLVLRLGTFVGTEAGFAAVVDAVYNLQ